MNTMEARNIREATYNRTPVKMFEVWKKISNGFVYYGTFTAPIEIPDKYLVNYSEPKIEGRK